MTSKSILFEIKPKETAIDSVLIQESQNQQYKWNIKWKNVFVFLYIHFTCIYVFVHIARLNKWTVLWFYFVGYISGIGTTAGAHRLWCHRAYKAKWPLRLILLILQTVSFQGTIYHWSRDHRLHHKFTDTDADPYNARRGVFFSHMGWLMIQKHPDVKTNGALIDWSDLKRDPFVAFQIKYYSSLIFVFGIVVPTMVPWLAWNESLWYSWAGNVTRFCLSLHCTWLVNSAAHIWGMRPYDKFISPTENTIVALLAGGEGWHNYHHIFPWDYKAAELGNYSLNITTAFIDFFALLGWAYDLKTASPDIVKKRVLRNSKETK
ncbi:acyl-CoA Delta(11) desaturase-like isoform X2 [Pseudomyrmex gracilis]|uniref:acyl-CoA Delta(11) desaturase-like isoform X2 n=1 Tax=Pseudomyrmex gracilis TaxID=219809 RepID=UPI000995BDF2|nr:acyl-CoA Delta(11) desaturase-like isoform X2 [Pseudomyrmex gracilis]